MKWIFFIALLLLLSLPAFGQTNISTNSLIPPQGYLSTNVNFIKMSDIQLDVGGIYNPSELRGKFGGFTALNLGVANNTAIGTSVAYLGNHFLYASVSIRLGTDVKLPYIGNEFMWIASGPAYSPITGSIGSYNFLGISKGFKFSNNWKAAISYGIGDISFISGLDQILAISVDYSW